MLSVCCQHVRDAAGVRHIRDVTRERVTTMPRVRRLALVAVLAILGGFALAGCRSEPGVAAFVGDTRITDADVDAVAIQIRDDRKPADPKDFRQQVLAVLLKQKLMAAALADHSLPKPAVDTTSYAENSGLKPDWRFTQAAAEGDTYLDAATDAYVKGLSQPLTPSEADQREAYNRIRSGGQALPPFEDVRQFFVGPAMSDALARRSVLADSVKRHPVRLSPRYDGFVLVVPFTVGNAPTALGVPIGLTASPSPSSP